MIGISRKQVEHTEYIFVDFFDTLMFRSVHSCQMTEAWDRALARKLELAAGKLRDCRRAVLAEAHDRQTIEMSVPSIITPCAAVSGKS